MDEPMEGGQAVLNDAPLPIHSLRRARVSISNELAIR